MTPAMTQNAFDQLHHYIKHHSMPLNGNQAQQKSYYMRYSTPAFISSNRKSSKKIKIRKWITEWTPPLEKREREREGKKRREKLPEATWYHINTLQNNIPLPGIITHSPSTQSVLHQECVTLKTINQSPENPRAWKANATAGRQNGMTKLSSLSLKVVRPLKPDVHERSLRDGCGSAGWTSRDKSTSCCSPS